MLVSFIQLNIGCLSRNRYWGEADDHAYRNARCSSVLLESKGKLLLVDPGIAYEEMKILLDERCGKKIEDIDYIFFTHLHGDHRVEALKYKHSLLYAGSMEIQDLKQSGDEELGNRLLIADELLFPGVEPILLPGHTRGCMGLVFESDYGKSLVAGDCVMTKDFFVHETGYFNSWDLNEAARTIKMIKNNYRLIIPGHDILFMNKS